LFALSLKAQKYHNISKNAIKSQLIKALMPMKRAQKYHNISKNAIKSQPNDVLHRQMSAQKYHNISKNAIKSQPFDNHQYMFHSAKIPQYFKECNQVTTLTSSQVIKN